MEAPCVTRLALILQAIAVPGATFVFLLFWTLIYHPGFNIRPIFPFTHGVNCFVVLLDFFTNAQPYPLANWCYVLVYALLYLLWTGIFDVSGLRARCDCDSGPDSGAGCKEKGDDDDFQDRCVYIYPSVNWRTPVATTILCLVLVFIAFPILCFILWNLSVLKRNCGGNFLPPSISEKDEEVQMYKKNYCQSFRDQFSFKRLKPEVGDWVSTFGKSPLRFFSEHPQAFLIHRAFVTVVMVAILIWSIIEQSRVDFIYYLTNWTLIVQIGYHLSAFQSTYFAIKEFEGEKSVRAQVEVPEIL